MTRASLLERGLWILGLLLAVSAGRSLVSPVSVTIQALPIPLRPSQASTPADSLARWAAAVASRDPFRLARRPAAVRFGAAPLVQSAAGPRPRPALQLGGILGGPPWRAIVEGLPGTNGGVLVREGEVIGAFMIRQVGRDVVVISGADTTWTLRLRETWR